MRGFQRWPAAEEIKSGSSVVLFDGRYAEVMSEPETTPPIGRWAVIREVLNAKDPNFLYPEYGPEETVQLAGARNAMARSREVEPS